MKVKSVKIIGNYDKKFVYDLSINDTHNYFVGKSEVNVHNSGKSFVVQNIFGIPDSLNISVAGLKLVNQDREFEHFLTKYGYGLELDKMPKELFRQLTDPEYQDYSGLRSRTKELSKKRLKLYTQGRLGVIIDGTGHVFNKIAKQKKELENIGYDAFMIFVNTSLDVALKRNSRRKRKLTDELVKKSWKEVQDNIGKFQRLFGKNFVVVDNSKFVDNPEKYFTTITKKYIPPFMKAPIKNPIGKRWIENQLELKRRK